MLKLSEIGIIILYWDSESEIGAFLTDNASLKKEKVTKVVDTDMRKSASKKSWGMDPRAKQFSTEIPRIPESFS